MYPQRQLTTLHLHNAVLLVHGELPQVKIALKCGRHSGTQDRKNKYVLTFLDKLNISWRIFFRNLKYKRK